MSPLRKAIRTAVVAGWATLLPCGDSVGQPSQTTAASEPVLRTQWEQRVVRPQAAPVPQQRSSVRRSVGWHPVRPKRSPAAVAAVVQASEPAGVEPAVAEPEVAEPEVVGPGIVVEEGDMQLGDMEPIPRGEEMGLVPMEESFYPAEAPNVCGETCGSECLPSGECFDGACYPPLYGPFGGRGVVGWLASKSSLFAGVQGFKGPADLGRNGNFGFHEGVSLSGPLGGPFGIGYEVGMRAVHSNFHGDQTAGVVSTSNRDQVFFTAGLFRRAVYRRWQWGVVFDLLHDNYHGTADFKQIRAELSFKLDPLRDAGFWGAFSAGDDQFLVDQDGDGIDDPLPMEATDLYAFFYRRQYPAGGEARFWAGFSGDGDALLGADCAIALGRSWALENRASYLIPHQRAGSGGQQEESWNLSIQLVWYLGRNARRERANPFRPLMGVADNSLFLLDRR